MKRLFRWGVASLVMVLVAAVAIAWHRPIEPTPGPPSGFSADQVAKGAELAAIGDCAVCHTASGGRPYAGGRAVPTPFGAVYATNITPDPDTGIGRWSPVAFRRAMREGIDREGDHLYPVLPYPHFTRATDADTDAIYAFLMTRAPVRQTTPETNLPFPFNQRILLAYWNLLFLKPGVWQPDPSRDAAWNRGAYLVEAVGHCGACHSPHNALGAEVSNKALSGGEAEDWYAPPLQQTAQAWTQEALVTYLRTGFQAQHGAASGPMTAVTEELARVPEQDVQAIATYIGSLVPQGAPQPVAPRGGGDPQARALFEGACGGCHSPNAPMTLAGAPSLSVSSAVNAPTPQSVIQVILHGLPWREGKAAPYMPAFGDALTDQQIAALVGYLRAQYTDKPAWNDVSTAVAKARGTS